MNCSTIGDRIRNLRKANHLTQDELANKLDASRVQVNQWENGSREISNSRIINLADLFNVSCDYLLTGKTDIHPACSGTEKSKNQDSQSFNTLLSKSTLEAFNSLNDLPDDKKELYLIVVNGILGSNAFWKIIIPDAVKSIESKTGNNKAETIPEGLKEKFVKCAQILNLANSAGYTDEFAVTGDKILNFRLNEAKDCFANLLEGIIDYYSSYDNKNLPNNKNFPEILQEYDSEMKKNEVDDFIRFLDMFEI